MANELDTNQLLDYCNKIAVKAGDAVMEIYDSGQLDVELKADNSPLTKADKLANQIIETGLQEISNVPIISEEGNHWTDSDEFWLVDPIDGTKEFISHNGEFTINIGLIKNGRPVLGVVYAPARDTLYYAAEKSGAFKIVNNQMPQKIWSEYTGHIPTVVVSRSHINKETEDFISNLGEYKLIKSGSSLKLCLVAEGAASIYPRFSPTSIWDTAASDAILREAGGQMKDIDGNTLSYDPSRILNPYFCAVTKN